MPNSSLLDAQLKYESLESLDIDSSISNLDSALAIYSNSQKTSSDRVALESAFTPIAEYYSKLVDINTNLQAYINSAAKTLADSDPKLLSEERYSNRIHPEESVEAREPTMGLIPELRVTTLPYIIGISVFMASLSIFLIFQSFGFNGQINIPPSLNEMVIWLTSPADVPFYMNPMVLGGILIMVFVVAIILHLRQQIQIGTKE